mmetsp:Transcript_16789/g.33938  ORF Transcript_16789/g.33938 Transcript_16789/m.33938 type:complete len:545 (-) Transcript_16789:216-1850(-)
MIAAIVTTMMEWVKLLLLSMLAGALPVFGYYLGQYNARQECEKEKLEIAKDRDRDISDVDLSRYILKEEAVKERASSYEEEEVELPLTSSPKSSGTNSSLFREATKTQVVPKDRQQDLDFYKAILGKRVSTLAVSKVVKKTGLTLEVEFLGQLNKLRYDFAANTRLILKEFFSEDSKRRLQKQCDILNRCDREYNFEKPLGKTIKAFSPESIFDGVEQTTLLQIGDAVFPGYRENINGLKASVDAALRKVPIEQLRKRVYNELWDVDPDLVAAFHVHPPQPTKWVRRESLGILHKRGREHSMKSAIFSIELITVDQNDVLEAYQQPAKWVLITHTGQGAASESKSESRGFFSRRRTAVKPGKLRIDPIELGEAVAVKDDINPSIFEIKGKSVLHPKKTVSLILVAKDEECCDKWIESLGRFKRSRENASTNVALCLNFMLNFANNLYTGNYDALDVACEKLALHILDNGIGEVRPVVPLAVRAALYKAAGEDNWDDVAFKTTTAWMKLMLEATIEDLREFERYAEGGAFNRHMTQKKKGACVIS